MDNEFRTGFEKVAVSAGTIARVMNAAVKKHGRKVPSKWATSAEKNTTSYLHYPSDVRNSLKSEIERLQTARGKR